MAKTKQSRAQVSRQDFLRVTLVEREKFATAETAAAELGMTVSSFTQRLTREKKAYPGAYADFKPYGGNRGPKQHTADEVRLMLAELRGEVSEGAEGAEGAEATAESDTNAEA